MNRPPLITVIDTTELRFAAMALHTQLEDALLPMILCDPARGIAQANRCGVTAALFLNDDYRCIYAACKSHGAQGRDAACLAAVDLLRAEHHWSPNDDWGYGGWWTCKRLARYAFAWHAGPTPLQAHSIGACAMRLKHVHKSLLAVDRHARSALRELHAAVERPMRRAS